MSTTVVTAETRELIMKFGQRAVEVFQAESPEALDGSRTNNYLTMFAGYNSNLLAEYGELEVIRAQMWPELRKNATSDKQCDREWDATAHGLRQIELKYLLKALEKLMSACKSRIEQLKVESFNRQ
jgi:hypothetical protein